MTFENKKPNWKRFNRIPQGLQSNKYKGISACLANSELLVMNLKNTRKNVFEFFFKVHVNWLLCIN